MIDDETGPINWEDVEKLQKFAVMARGELGALELHEGLVLMSEILQILVRFQLMGQDKTSPRSTPKPRES